MMERLLYYIWKHRLFDANSLTTTSGEPLEIIDPGTQNLNAGPDFFNAKIRIGHTVWAGNVEIHTAASDWFKHHHGDMSIYDTVILHVIKQEDAIIYRQNGEAIPQLLLPYPDTIEQHYAYLLHSDAPISCSLRLHEIPTLFLSAWMDVLQTERLEQKVSRIQHLLHQCKNNWEETFYITLAHYFGVGVNGDAFERLARSLPFQIILKHSDSPHQVEALLFGQSGLLSADCDDAYFLSLKDEYQFLQQKYQLKEIDHCSWKWYRLRPTNFPEIKIAQFAAIYRSTTGLFSKILAATNPTELSKLFKVNPSPYWETHYNFGKPSSTSKKQLGEKMIDSLLINVVAPAFFSYGNSNHQREFTEKALKLLENLPAEQNHITKEWQECGLTINTAADSQALIQLKQEYCEKKKCIFCRIGQKLLAKT
ncbi:MAG: DUF2851 family protein [Bacteroidales bacterium]|jgi:hypothetical protein|nr:DUF2851 family protein [Bacteroidales bacterium]